MVRINGFLLFCIFREMKPPSNIFATNKLDNRVRISVSAASNEKLANTERRVMER